MNSYDLKFEIINKINNNLSLNPIVFYGKIFDKIFSEFEAKQEITNIMILKFSDLEANFFLNCKKNNIYFEILVICENFMMSERVAGLMIDRLEGFELDELRMEELMVSGGIMELDKNLYSKKIKFIIKG